MSDSFKIVNLGLPKIGTTTLTRALHCAAPRLPPPIGRFTAAILTTKA